MEQSKQPEKNSTDEEGGMQQTGNLRFEVLPNTEPRLQQEFVDRKTLELKWIDVPYIHIK